MVSLVSLTIVVPSEDYKRNLMNTKLGIYVTCIYIYKMFKQENVNLHGVNNIISYHRLKINNLTIW